MRTKSSFERLLFFVLYYALFKYLPEGYDHPAFRFGNRLRSWACSHLFAECGTGVNVHRGASFGSGRNVRAGNHANLGLNVLINGRGGVFLGEHVLMGPDIIIYTGTHTFADPNTPIQRQPMQYAPVKIGRDVWLGARVIVLPGVTVGDGCVVGANSVVTNDLPPYTIAAGSPARVIKQREEPSNRET